MKVIETVLVNGNEADLSWGNNIESDLEAVEAVIAALRSARGASPEKTTRIRIEL